MLGNVVAQIPPTPTLLPVPTAPLTVPEVGLWATTDEIIQLWNTNSGATTGLQFFLIAALVMAALFMILALIKGLRRE